MFIQLNELHPNPYQPPTRVEVSAETARKFGLSILESTLLQLPIGRAVDEGDGILRFEIGDGWQRRAGFAWLVDNGHPEYDKMPMIIRGFTDQQMADLVLEANDVRVDFNPIERAWYYNKYLSDFPSVTQAEFAQRHGRSQAEISNTIRLLDLPADVRQKIISHEISETHGRTLLQLGDKVLMSRLAEEVVEQELNVVSLDARVKQVIRQQNPPMPEPVAAQSQEETEAKVLDVRTCRVCGCDEDHPCLDPKTGEPCRWVGKDLCSCCQEPATTLTATEPVSAPVTETKSLDTGTIVTTPTAPAPAAAPAPPKPNWGRKLVIEEREGYVMLSVMKAGGTPSFKKVEGTLSQALGIAAGWLEDLEAEWEKEGK